MTALNTYRRWLARVEDDALRAELSALDEVRDAAQIEDRFYRDLAFGTGGLFTLSAARRRDLPLTSRRRDCRCAAPLPTTAASARRASRARPRVCLPPTA